MNGDGYFNNDLLYVPNSASELTFLPLTSGGKTFSPEQQVSAFDSFINQDPYLSTVRGQYSERNGGIGKWYNSVDFSVIQNIFFDAGNSKHTLQVRADIINIGNLINNSWGVLKVVNNDRPLASAGTSANGTPQYRLATQQINGETQLLRDTFIPAISTGSVWQAQLGVRYIFN
jgi:hypothetical protein